MPTWALALIVIAALAGSAWLFFADGSDDGSNDQSKGAKGDQAESVLSLPKNDDEATDERRRGDEGRERLDSDTTTTGTDADDSEDETETNPDLPTSFASLRGKHVAIAAASSQGNGDVERLVRIGSLRVPCATPKTDVARELAVAGAISGVLSEAGATTVGNDDDVFSQAQCVDKRVNAFKDADAAVVVRVTDADTPRVLIGRPSGDESDADSKTLAAEVAAALGLKSVTPASTAELRSLLARSGAIDAADGAAVVLVELPASSTEDGDARDQLAQDVVGAIAAFVQRADQQVEDASTDDASADDASADDDAG